MKKIMALFVSSFLSMHMASASTTNPFASTQKIICSVLSPMNEMQKAHFEELLTLIYQGNVPNLETFLSKRWVDINALFDYKALVLQKHCGLGHEELFAELQRSSVLDYAVLQGKTSIIEVLLRHGADCDYNIVKDLIAVIALDSVKEKVTLFFRDRQQKSLLPGEFAVPFGHPKKRKKLF